MTDQFDVVGSCRKAGRNGFIEWDILGLFLPNVLVHIFL